MKKKMYFFSLTIFTTIVILSIITYPDLRGESLKYLSSSNLKVAVAKFDLKVSQKEFGRAGIKDIEEELGNIGEILAQEVVNFLVQSKRVSVYSPEYFKSMLEEFNLSLTGVMNAEPQLLDKLPDLDYIVTGAITKMKISHTVKKTSSTSTTDPTKQIEGYIINSRAEVALKVKVINVKDKRISWEMEFSDSFLPQNYYNDELGDVQGISLGMQDAIWMNRYLKSCLKKAEPYLLSSFPIIGSVVKLKDSKSFIIDQGSKHGISPKQDIVIVRDSIKIAEGKVIEVQSSLSIVKIKKLISVNDLKAGDRIIGKEKYMNIETAIKMLEQ